MEYHEEFIVDFAKRTRMNLEQIEALSHSEADVPHSEKNVFEVTQLVNSMLGLLVFPRERYMDSIPDTDLTELEKQGWPHVRVTKGSLAENTLRQLMRMLRNSISHCNVKFTADPNRQVTGIRVWNQLNNSKNPTWEAELSIDDLRSIAIKFIEMITQNSKV